MADTAIPASTPFPENPERRAEVTRRVREATGLDDAILERLVRAFYERARRDPEIGAKFDAVRDWEEHIARITSFWSSVALLTGRYHGQPLAPHMKLDLHPRHFARWLVLWEQTVRETCPRQAVDYLVDKARRIATSMEMGVAVARGELPAQRASRA
jgi:hemoglobin